MNPLRKWLAERAMNDQEFCALAGISAGSLCRLKFDQYNAVRFRTVIAVSKATGIPISEFSDNLARAANEEAEL